MSRYLLPALAGTIRGFGRANKPHLGNRRDYSSPVRPGAWLPPAPEIPTQAQESKVLTDLFSQKPVEEMGAGESTSSNSR
jgi:hypothetical protein